MRQDMHKLDKAVVAREPYCVVTSRHAAIMPDVWKALGRKSLVLPSQSPALLNMSVGIGSCTPGFGRAISLKGNSFSIYDSPDSSATAKVEPVPG
jgi:hypothetical protein